MNRRLWIAVLLVCSGCVTPPLPLIPTRYQVTAPSADAAEGRVYLRNDLSRNGNSYAIEFFALRNVPADLTNGPSEWAAMYYDIATNVWPYKRSHVDLSIDGGHSWCRRIGYGIPANATRTGGVFQWSPPEDYSLLTTAAVIRVTNLDGTAYEGAGRTPAMPYDVPAGTYITSSQFAIVGACITAPAGGTIQWRGEQTQIVWRQLGAGPVMDLYWLTPTSMGVDYQHWITTISNCVDGATNTKWVSLNVPACDAAKLVLVSKSDPVLHGYSDAFTVDP